MTPEKSAGLIQNLERSCDGDPARLAGRNGWVRCEPPGGGIERMEAFFRGQVYEPHRHDVYGIGVTTSGVQCFTYRGAGRTSLPGHTIVLHPDELHDGAAGNEAGFGYRMLYLEPALVSTALDGRPLPFVAGGLSMSVPLWTAASAALSDFGEPVDDLRRGEIVIGLAEALEAASEGTGPKRRQAVDAAAIARTRAFLAEDPERAVDNTMLEEISGLDRWALARQFRSVCGTSPYRFFLMRRLERVRALITGGAGLAEAALATGFSDQSHMTRHFAKAYGMPPGRWARLGAEA
jgi:AraC-like DNA-binding protein